MKTLKQENIKELKEKVIDLVAKTAVELGQRLDSETLRGLSQILAKDLINEKRFGTMTFEQIQEAFHQGVRFCDFDPFLNIRTFYKFIIAHKKIINDAYYQVHTLVNNPKEVPFYQSQKLLK